MALGVLNNQFGSSIYGEQDKRHSSSGNSSLGRGVRAGEEWTYLRKAVQSVPSVVYAFGKIALPVPTWTTDNADLTGLRGYRIVSLAKMPGARH